MFSETLLLHGWTLRADELPETDETVDNTGFTLPGALSLKAFSDLLGMDEDEPEETTDGSGMRVCFPGKLPEGVRGKACVSREIDFGRMTGTRAMLEIDHLCGTGAILLGEKELLSFSGGMDAAVDVTDALRLRKKQTLFIRFDDAQQAGIFGAALLHAADGAYLETVRLSPDAARQTLGVEVVVRAEKAGKFALRAALAGTQEQTQTPWRETGLQMDRAGVQTVRFAMVMPAPCFAAGQRNDLPVLKLALHVLPESGKGPGMTADARTIMTGYHGQTPGAYVPLSREECALAPDELIAYAKSLHVHALYVPERTSGLLFRRAALEGVCLLTQAAPENPCAARMEEGRALPPVSRAGACWQLCGMPSMPPMPDAQATDRELLFDAAGREIDPDEMEAAQTINALRTLMMRLRAEAARQGQYAGPLCAPGEWREREIAGAIRTAFAPLHLSVLPLRGAWWAQSFFSATIQAFIPQEERNGAYSAEAELLGADGTSIASLRRDIARLDGPLGIIEGRLPDKACRLTLRARLRRSGAMVLEEEFPVYVGVRGPLEAAFAL